MRTHGVDTVLTLAVLGVVGEVAFEPAHLRLAFEGDDVGGDTVEEPTIVGHDHGASGVGLDGILQRPQRVDVEVVRGLVEKEHIRTFLQHLGQVHTVALTAREVAHQLLLVGPLEVERRHVRAAVHLSAADLEMACEITHNAKTQRIGVCNAAESLVVHADVAETFLPMAAAVLDGVELVGDERARAIVDMGVARDDDFATEFLAMKMSVKVVDDLDEAISHVNETSTGHSEAIITNDIVSADRFAREVDAAAVLVNASTRFVDGEEFGFGAEIGISTQKLHARGPMGLEQLTTEKFVVRGTGQIRG